MSNKKTDNAMRNLFIEKIYNICDGKKAEEVFLTYIKSDGTEDDITYRSFGLKCELLMQKFQKSMLRRNDRVLVLTPMSPFGCIAVSALAISELVSVVLNPQLPEEELDSLVKKSDISGIVCDEEIYQKYAYKWTQKYPVFNIKTGDLFLDREYFSEPSKDSDDVLAILYSSGTTSEPKGVMITYEAQMKSAELLLRAFGTNDIRYLLVFPMFHVSGFSVFFALFLGGGQIGLLENTNSIKLMDGFQKYKPNAFGMVPKVYETFYTKIVSQLNNKKFAMKMLSFCGWLNEKLHIKAGNFFFRKINKQVFGGKMKFLGTGGGKCSREVGLFFQRMGYYWMNTYASTEMNLPMLTTTVYDRFPSDSIGKITSFPEILVRIQNPDANGIGEIQVKTPCHMKGYFRDEKATKEAYEDGYFKTGDLGYCDSKGYLYITGRSKESIHLRNGEKVTPEQLENLYADCIPENVMAACVGVPVEEAGYDEVVFFLEKDLIKDTALVTSQFMNRSKELGGDYRIADVQFIDKIPLSSIGKVQRYKLRNKQVMDENKSQVEYSEKELDTHKQLEQILRSLGVQQEIREKSVLEDDLAIDSLNLFELCVEIEKQFGVNLTNCISAQLTVKQLCELIEHQGENAQNTVSYDVEKYPMKRHIGDRFTLSAFRCFTKLFYKFEVSGVEYIPEKGPYIICANHQSHLDGMWIMAAGKKKIKLEDFCCMAKQEHLDSGISRRGLRLTGGIPVARGANTSPALKRVLECLQQGKVVLIHLEGTRTTDGKIGEFKSGAEKIALEADVPILPVRIEGAYEIYPKNQKLPHMIRKGGRYPLKIQFYPTLSERDEKKDFYHKYLLLNKEEKQSEVIKEKKKDKLLLSSLLKATKMLWHFNISGLNYIEKGKNYIICSNHTSYLDPVWILSALGKTLGKKEFVTLAAAERRLDSKRFFRLLRCIPVERERGTHPEIDCVKEHLLNGSNAIIFPEGARSRDGGLLPLKKGVIKIAKDTGISILPIYIEGGFEIYPRHEKSPKLFNWKQHKRYPLNITVQEPLNPLNYDEQEMFKQLEKKLKGEDL